MVIAAISVIFCGCSVSSVAPNKAEGYPVYKFLDFGDYRHRKELRVINSEGREIGVYIRNADYKRLWAINPHDLNSMGKSHFVTIEYSEMEDEGRSYHWATSFDAVLVDHAPYIRK